LQKVYKFYKPLNRGVPVGTILPSCCHRSVLLLPAYKYAEQHRTECAAVGNACTCSSDYTPDAAKYEAATRAVNAQGKKETTP